MLTDHEKKKDSSSELGSVLHQFYTGLEMNLELIIKEKKERRNQTRGLRDTVVITAVLTVASLCVSVYATNPEHLRFVAGVIAGFSTIGVAAVFYLQYNDQKRDWYEIQQTRRRSASTERTKT